MIMPRKVRWYDNGIRRQTVDWTKQPVANKSNPSSATVRIGEERDIAPVT